MAQTPAAKTKRRPKPAAGSQSSALALTAPVDLGDGLVLSPAWFAKFVADVRRRFDTPEGLGWVQLYRALRDASDDPVIRRSRGASAMLDLLVNVISYDASAADPDAPIRTIWMLVRDHENARNGPSGGRPRKLPAPGLLRRVDLPAAVRAVCRTREASDKPERWIMARAKERLAAEYKVTVGAVNKCLAQDAGSPARKKNPG